MFYADFSHVCFFFSSRRRHTRCALVTGVRRVLFRSGGRRRDRDRTEERNEPPIWGQMAENASLPERRRSCRDAARSGARCPGTWASGNLQERREPRAFWGSRGKPGLASRAAARARARAGRASRSEEHTSELQSLLRIPYTVSGVQKKIRRP